MTRIPALVALAAIAAPRAGIAVGMRADTSASAFTIRVKKAGVLSSLGHDHELTPASWRADAELDADRPSDLRVDVVVDAASLHDRERGLSQKDRAQVDRQTAGPRVLDAQRFPEVRFRGTARDVRAPGDRSVEGLLHGTLTLHGVSRPLDVPFRAHPNGEGYLASGAASFRQSAFGMKPYATAFGTIAVRDEVRVEFELAFRPASADSAAASAGARGTAGRPAPERHLRW